MKVSVLLPAAGSGERIGRGPKAFLRVGGKTLLEWALEGFAWADEVVVALPPGFRMDGLKTVPGGQTRQQSVFNLVQAATGEVVLVHDVARPFVVRSAVERLLEAVRATGAASLVVSVPDTLVREEAGRYGEVIAREHHRLVQTPQGFRRELLWQAHQQARAAGIEFTDDAQLVRWLGHPVVLVEGDRRMFKVTYPEDLILAEGLAQVWNC
ncbi:2-C-methyl-D-erythritol 4-phosphate cytidylyltransferase [Meiothermus ruber]|jgi:2-C-methyl-D-erythritol 4-phosphate cytidylyltransferase|uniref:2-C-methyl-D-erythritol 4-phosphate cytidylyltransferase n=1 Tax=Meiothermus ruber (strain ATCC 35948 / DSM 1279 / VKM B-1258 / 21) TaxID=504728 RepID=D3PMQ5_MEIRD|nr:2-C-methyl-D-erythritol 4-phosphate cytidylyltransferase [Meiothermus ruber]ADD27230.1 2-C-methyl-D-erythritol 4-phosphate cytidylyltransferase [Meiothermus ruber DSM 1279]AGK03682.1 2-C-methyl-D-erythritol 4-phosphate cytidylyltransferase [Meiothermus ruber DSM 1279]MCL6530008.1 2-C-methyl-D-erythritol 4-phosphate cytidylyltransferase [Meiothermus ruber]MCX7801860.1 2-C-methyl-D-erythritol 4-phosphate cytidylyltransferase [Meiothermus ruber]GAO74154.1 2-C-methyl-D-erythritol 4-phosphate cy